MKPIDILRQDAREISERINGAFFADKRILVTGATGVIGTALVSYFEYLHESGNAPKELIAVSRSGLPEGLSHLSSHPLFRWEAGDLTNSDFTNSLPESDIIIHGAGYGQPGRFMEDRLKTLRLNTQSTWELLEKLGDDGHFLFISTSELYSGAEAPYKEEVLGTTNTDHFRSCYIEGKRCGEAICAAAREAGKHAVSARLSLAYGPGTRTNDQRVLNNFIKKAFMENSISLMDMGMARRIYCYAVDAVAIMLRILMEGSQPYYNVGGNSFTTIGGLAKLVGEITQVPVVFPQNDEGALEGAPQDVNVSMDRYIQEFGDIPYISLEEGLNRTINWQKSLYR